MSETWQVVIEQSSELLVEVEAADEQEARRIALEAAGDAAMSSWDNEELRTINAWRKADHDAFAESVD